MPWWKGRGSTKVPPRSRATRPHRWALAAAERRFHDARRVHRNKHICVGAAGKGGLGQLLVEFLQCGKSRLVQHAAAPEQLAPVRAILRGPHRTGTCLCVSSSHRDAATVAVVLASLRHGALLSVGHHGQDGASPSLPEYREGSEERMTKRRCPDPSFCAPLDVRIGIGSAPPPCSCLRWSCLTLHWWPC